MSPRRLGGGIGRGLVLAAAVALVLVAVVAWLVAAWRPAPPRTLRMATGPEAGAYAEAAKRYQAILARSDVRLELEPTEGAVENLARLRDDDSGVGAAFVQAGTTTAEESPDLVSLGTVFYEPLWIFHRRLDPSAGFAALAGRRVSVGREGSGTRTLVLRILGLGGIDSSSAQLLALSPEEAAERLVAGEIDAAAILASWQAPVVRSLLASPGIAVASFPRAAAHVALTPYLTKLVLPAGVADLARNIPPGDVVLVAPKASLAVRRDLHPALQYLLLDAAAEIHAPPGIFQGAGEFPAPEALDLPLTREAQQFYRTGRPFFQRHLPFWLAVLAEQLSILLVPIVGALYPLLRLFPALYAWSVKRRVTRLYGELRLLELSLDSEADEAVRRDLLSRLDALEARASHLRLPRVFATLAYTLQHHIRLVRERQQRRD